MSDVKMDSSYLRGMTCRRIGNVVNFHDSIPSTNDLAKEMAEGGCEDGTVVIAEKQTGGKGRNGRRWESPEGGLYMSVVLKGGLDLDNISTLPLIFGLAVSKAISTTTMMESSLKWPNDVLLYGNKVCGILMEASVKAEEVEYVVVGIGLNVNNRSEDLDPGIREGSISLSDRMGSEVDRKELLRNLLYMLDLHYDRYLGGGAALLLEEWTNRAETVGRDVRIEGPMGTVEGKALGVDQAGALMVRENRRITRVTSGDCLHLE